MNGRTPPGQRRDPQAGQQRPDPVLRELYFADAPLATLADKARGDESEDSPWALFRKAATTSARGDTAGARQCLHRVLETPNLECLLYLQAWHSLRELGEQPDPSVARTIRGVVIDVALNGGLDTVVAYADYRARYFNHTGAVIFLEAPGISVGRHTWKAPGTPVDPQIEALLGAGQCAVNRTGPHDGPRLAAPGPGDVCLSLLTFGGIHVGIGPYEEMRDDEIGGPVLTSAYKLMQALIANGPARKGQR